MNARNQTAWGQAVLVGVMAWSWFAAVGVVAGEDRPELSVTESAEGILVSQGEKKILFYQRRPKSWNGKFTRADYVHPLYGLDGATLTEDFPADHRHHRGVFWTWHQVWIGDRQIGDPWVAKDFIWDVVSAEARPGKVSANLKVGVLWKSPQWTDDAGRPKPIVKETTNIVAHRQDGDFRAIDFEINLLALAPNVRIGGSDDAKGYGGFSVRLRLPQDARFTGVDGAVRPQNLAVKAGPGVDVSAGYGKEGQTSGVTILCHPSTPGFPQPWVLRQSRSMQNPQFPGREPTPLSAEKPLTLRYRLIVHRGAASPSHIQSWQAAYAKTNPPR